MTVPGDSWEERMAARAAVRRAEREAEERARASRDWQEMIDKADARAWEGVADVTLGEAVESLRYRREFGPSACACVGPPGCCRFGWRQMEALQWAAHIAVRQLSDLADRRDPSWRVET